MESRFLPRLLFLAAGVLLSQSDPPGGRLCDKIGDEPNCVCRHPNGTIDLRPLSSKNGSRFNISDQYDNYRYYYNPCLVFSMADRCKNVFACQVSKDASLYFPLADTNTEQMYYTKNKDKNSVILYYSSPTEDGSLREAKVHLICDQDAVPGKESISTKGDYEIPLTYQFRLTTCYACPGGCKASSVG